MREEVEQLSSIAYASGVGKPNLVPINWGQLFLYCRERLRFSKQPGVTL
jgi:hypothetical protein